jgi:hypothetical protein
MSDAPQIVSDRGKFIELSDEQLAEFDDAKRERYRRVGEALSEAELTDAELIAAKDRVVECARALEVAQSRVPKLTQTDLAREFIRSAHETAAQR